MDLTLSSKVPTAAEVRTLKVNAAVAMAHKLQAATRLNRQQMVGVARSVTANAALLVANATKRLDAPIADDRALLGCAEDDLRNAKRRIDEALEQITAAKAQLAVFSDFDLVNALMPE